MSNYVRSNRRQQRAEIQETWNVYDARRPIRAEDMAVPPQPEPETAEASPAPQGGTTSHAALDAVLAHRLETADDASIAALFGLTEMEVREARKWAREQDERLGAVTITASDQEH